MLLVSKHEIQLFRRFVICQILNLTARFRSVWLLKIVRVLYKLSNLDLLIRLYDPNVIRKKINYRFEEQIVSVKLNEGGSLLVDINDHIGWRIFMTGFWDNLVLEVSRVLELRENDTLLDIGANIGATSIPVAVLLGVDIIAIEASEINAKLFRKNVDLNSVKSILHQVAVVSPSSAGSNRLVILYENNGNHGSNSLNENWNSSTTDKKTQYASTATIDSLLSHAQLNKIKLIKIDIEGSENEALMGFTYLNQICAPLIFEYRIDNGSEKTKKSLKQFALTLSYSFDLYGIRMNKGYFELVEFKFDKACENAIALPLIISNKLRSIYPTLFKLSE